MLHEKTIEHIKGLSDEQLVEYVMVGRRVYEEEPLAFAQKELESRHIPPVHLAALRQHFVPLLTQYDAQASIDEKPGRQVSILCQHCGYEVPTLFAEYGQNIGAFVLRLTTRRKGCFCRKCHRRIFWHTTLITVGVGWWGLISFFITPAVIFSNLVSYARARSLPASARYARRPKLDEETFAKLWRSSAQQIMKRLEAGEDAEDVSRDIAPHVDQTPGEVLCFIREMIRRTRPSAPLPPPPLPKK